MQGELQIRFIIKMEIEEIMFSKELIDKCICNDFSYYDWVIDSQNLLILDEEIIKVNLDKYGVVLFGEVLKKKEVKTNDNN